MRISVPKAIHICSELNLPTVSIHPYQGSIAPKEKVMIGVYLPGDSSLMDVDTGFWFNTHGRRYNNVVHSKLIGEGKRKPKPTSVDSHGYHYHDEFHEGGNFCWIDDIQPYSIPTNVKSCWRGSMLNRSTYCARLRFYVMNMTSGRYSSAISYSIEYYVPQIVTVGKWNYKRVYRRTYSGTVELNYSNERLFDQSSWWWRTTLSYAGTHSATPSYVDSSIPDKLGTLATGLTGTFRGAYGPSSTYYWMAPGQDIFERMGEILTQAFDNDNWLMEGIRTNWSGWSYSDYRASAMETPDLVPSNERFLFHEDQLIAEGIDPYLITRHGLPNYWRNVLTQHAYLDTLESVPTLNDNSISNIIEIASFIKALVIDHEIDIPKRLGDVWLSYRYSYTTTKLDAEEAINFVHRYCDLGGLDHFIKCFGSSSITYTVDDLSVDVTCRCCLSIRPRDVAILEKIWRSLYTYGLQPNFYVVWDMIPYSFIIDWLIPIGNLAHIADASKMYSGTYYEIEGVNFSLSYSFKDDVGNVYHQYSRWLQDDIPQLNGFYFFEEDPASLKVKGMRVLDTLSLFIGKG